MDGGTSTEVDARLSFDVEQSAGARIIAMYEANGAAGKAILIKLPRPGNQAAKILKKDGTINMTLLFSFAQAAAVQAEVRLIHLVDAFALVDEYLAGCADPYPAEEDPGARLYVASTTTTRSTATTPLSWAWFCSGDHGARWVRPPHHWSQIFEQLQTSTDLCRPSWRSCRRRGHRVLLRSRQQLQRAVPLMMNEDAMATEKTPPRVYANLRTLSSWRTLSGRNSSNCKVFRGTTAVRLSRHLFRLTHGWTFTSPSLIMNQTNQFQ